MKKTLQTSEDIYGFPNEQKILMSLTPEKLKGGTISLETYDKNKNLMLSGVNSHAILVVEDPEDKDFYLIIAYFTSSKEEGNFFLGSQNIQGKNKDQMLHCNSNLIKIPKSSFIENSKIMDYMFKKDNVVEVIITSLKERFNLFSQNQILGLPFIDKIKFISFILEGIEDKLLDIKASYNNLRLDKKSDISNNNEVFYKKCKKSEYKYYRNLILSREIQDPNIVFLFQYFYDFHERLVALEADSPDLRIFRETTITYEKS